MEPKSEASCMFGFIPAFNKQSTISLSFFTIAVDKGEWPRKRISGFVTCTKEVAISQKY